VIAATDDPLVNAAVWQECRQLGCLVNVVDDPERCNFILPSLVRRDELAIAITTGGASPALARRLREKLEISIGPEYGTLASIMGELRPTLTGRIPAHRRLDAALELIDSGLLEVIQNQGVERAFEHAQKHLERIAAEAQDTNDA
jgi:precorrin-2 dehydrogenase/sirohydrochlorin ferrochelatase